MNRLDDPTTPIKGGISDAEIIARVLKGEKDLYAIIVRRYNEKLYRVGMSIMNDDAEVEDAMQTAYINAYESLQKFTSRAAFSTWLTRILINECILRLKRRKRSVLINEWVINNIFYPGRTMDVQTPAATMMNSELKQILEDAIRKLPQKYRAVFVMRELENMNVAETQACLNISETNVKVRFNRAKILLRNRLNSYYNKEDIFQFHLSRCDQMVERVLEQIIRVYKVNF
ncbi:MAG TPA: RNA polymerase sigma factor [Flavisolibacter sp.]|nr:RNA polymerase sigma factor [Flavisolibacter sp.]